ncbi:MAG: hypothetical protein L0154_00710 [Chloroflexi bacterium]|nr:hypothetical protein [Chloroflexota bacterium]
MDLAAALKVTRGRKLRTDGTVVETTIHYPTDSSLLTDGVRVLSRQLKRAQRMLANGVARATAVFRDRRRSARRLKHQIEQAARQGHAKTEPLYHKLVKISRATLIQAQQVADHLETLDDAAATTLSQSLHTFIARTQQVIDHHIQQFDKPPRQASADRGVQSASNAAYAYQRGSSV